MVADKKKIAAECWVKGNEALSRENWDYAIDMFQRAVGLAPDNLVYRQTLRGAECRKYKNNKTGARMAKMRLVGVKGKIKKARMQSKWEAVDRAAEEGLALNPWDPQLNADIAEACAHLGYSDVAVFGYQKALEADADNKGYYQHLAQLQEERGEYDEARKCWERVHKLDPNDSSARSKVTQLEASAVMSRGGYEEAESTQDVKTAYDFDRPTKSAIPDAVETPGENLEVDLKHAIRKDESNPDNYLKLADLYRRQKRLDDAIEVLKQAFEVSGEDANIREQLEDVELVRMRQELERVKEGAQSDAGDESAREQAATLAKHLIRREIEVFSDRVKRYPKDTRLKYDLAQRLMRVKQWGQAIPLLQQASVDSRLEANVLVALGKCFLHDKRRELAQRQFERATEKIDAHDHPELFKESHYMLGRLYQEAGRRQDAEHAYNEVLAVDYEFRDTLQRLEELQARGDGSK